MPKQDTFLTFHQKGRFVHFHFYQETIGEIQQTLLSGFSRNMVFRLFLALGVSNSILDLLSLTGLRKLKV